MPPGNSPGFSEEIDPENQQVLRLRIENLLAVDQAATALDYCQRALTRHPKRHIFWYLRSLACKAQTSREKPSPP